MRLLPYGPSALLAEFTSLGGVLGATAALRRAAVPGVIDIVPAARTVLVVHRGADPALIAAALDSGDDELPPPIGTVRVPVRYDGADLEEVAAAVRLTVAEVVALHSGATYRVAFCGFLPGFAYLIGLPEQLHLPRRRTPRPRVAAGTVAIAGEYAGVYPADSPGGWLLLGSTDAALWDPGREPPGLLAPGTDVVFEVR
jgi:KipI family sensor histidine kinase inhibitor